jgi:glutathione peroxidase
MPGERSIYDFILPGLDGQPIALDQFRDRKMLIVNTASECGFTAQYAQLQELHDHFKGEVAIIGCPSNDFGNQEPGDHQQIAEFCKARFGVSFPLTAKLCVTGPNRHPFYAWLEEQRPEDGAIRWNFQKFLVDEMGQVTHVFAPSEDPLSDAVMTALQVA